MALRSVGAGTVMVLAGLLAAACSGSTGDLPITSVMRADDDTLIVNSVCADQVTASWELRSGVPVVRIQGNRRGGDCGSSVELTDAAFIGVEQLRDGSTDELHRVRVTAQGPSTIGG